MTKSKQLLFSFLLICFLFNNGYATSKDSTLLKRGLYQQMFLSKNIKLSEPDNGFMSDIEFLDFMKALSKKWANSVPNQSDAYKRLDIYAVMWATYRLFKKELPDNSKCLIYSKIALPSFINDIEYLKEKLNSKDSSMVDATNLIRRATLDWATSQPPTFNCDLDNEQWGNLKNLIYEYPDIIQEYIDSDLVKNSLTQSKNDYLRSLYFSAKSIYPILELQDKLYENQLDKLYEDLDSMMPNSRDDLYMYVLIGKKLFERYFNNQQKDKAYAVLDLLAENTSNNSLSRVELKGLYEKVAQQEGLQRYSDIASKKNALTLSNSQKELDLNLFDATSNKNYFNAGLNNKLMILDFWSVSCGPCIKKIPNLNLIHEKHKDIVTLISINSDIKLKLSKLQDFIKDKAISYPVLVDNKADLMKEFNVIGWPAYFLIDSNGFFFKEPIENRINLSLEEIEEYLNR